MQIDNTKNKILSVAHKLFSRFGFHKTSMDEIAKIARKAKGSLYYHFTSKEELFKEVVAKEISNLKDQLKTIIVNPNMAATDKIKSYLIKRMEILKDAPNYHETIKADLYEHLEFVDDIRNELDDWEKLNLKKIIEQGIAKGEIIVIDEINALIDVFLMLVKGLEIPFFIQNKYEKSSRSFDGLLQILFKGLAV